MNDGTATSISSADITPGTCFMRRLHSFLTLHLASVVENNTWGDVEIVYSGYNVEGEGEHKIIAEMKK